MKTSWKELRYSYLTGFLFLQDQHKQMQNKTRRNHIFLVKYKKIIMNIEGNKKEIEAMEQFHKGNRQEGLRLQEQFAAAFREEYKDKDHCPCKKACRYHGNCKECVAIHRAHQEHVPNCMRPIINAKIKLLSELTEHTIANEIEAPHEILRKEYQSVETD